MTVSEAAPDDEVLFEEESTENDELAIQNGGTRRIRTQAKDPLIESLWRQQKKGSLILQPEFQRNFVWDRAQSSRLVESVLLDVPLPTIYLVEEKDGKVSVIDGQQRLTSFFRFLDGELTLSGLRILTELNGKKFADLDDEKKNKFENAALRTITIERDSDPNLRFEIFERLNTGSVALTEQELRNCVYRGPYNNLLIELSNDADFRFIAGFAKPDKRMRDVQLVLRAAAFYHATYLGYKPPMAAFLNNDMETFQHIVPAKADELRKQFKKSTSLIRSMLGKNAFKRFYAGRDGNHNGYWEPKKINRSLYDVLMWGFTQYDKNQVMPHLERLNEALIALMTDDQDFINSIELSTSGKPVVQMRFDKWRAAMEAVIGSQTTEPRCFSYQLKRQLYDANAVCAICSQRIHDIDDAAVDHIEQYWLGGRTIPENARLAHRYCNMARSKHDVVTSS